MNGLPVPGSSTRPLRVTRRGCHGAAVMICCLALAASACTKSPEAETSTVILEAASSSGDSPWTASVATATGATERSDQANMTRTSLSGNEAGLYGGSLDVSVCDKEKLSNFLEHNPAQASAFKSVVHADNVRTYVNSLTPVVLTRDTRVTNNGFENNAAAPFQAVLQTGTAILIDDRGLPRVRCACGNPLTEPSEARPEYTGTAWKNFAADQITTVSSASEPMTETTVTSMDATGPPTTVPVAATQGLVGTGTPTGAGQIDATTSESVRTTSDAGESSAPSTVSTPYPNPADEVTGEETTPEDTGFLDETDFPVEPDEPSPAEVPGELPPEQGIPLPTE